MTVIGFANYSDAGASKLLAAQLPSTRLPDVKREPMSLRKAAVTLSVSHIGFD